MRKLRTALLATATVSLLFSGASATVAAPETDRTSPKAAVSAWADASAEKASSRPADGRVWVWEHAGFSGNGCGMTYNQQDYRNLGSCSNMDNIVSSVWNSGYVGTFDDVRLHEGYAYSGVRMCISVGDEWGNLDLGYEKFNDGTKANDRISSHIWASSCP
ncbi:hypothetical protein AB0M97_25405 [Streptomyces sp. NPDC051207]|uniref:hypothetical protein n=1 Tax=Streptomyces sp. NPDC051207 TaxID=3154641 RepID=UPI003420F5BB